MYIVQQNKIVRQNAEFHTKIKDCVNQSWLDLSPDRRGLGGDMLRYRGGGEGYIVYSWEQAPFRPLLCRRFPRPRGWPRAGGPIGPESPIKGDVWRSEEIS